MNVFIILKQNRPQLCSLFLGALRSYRGYASRLPLMVTEPSRLTF